jgi:hypothetical protein
VEGVYFIKHEFPFPVFDEHAVGRFKKQQQTLTITLPMVPQARMIIQKTHLTAADVLSAPVLSDKKTQPFATTTSPIVFIKPLHEKAASVTSVDVKAAADISVAPVAKAKAVTVVEAVLRSVGDPFNGFNNCMESLESVKWNHDVYRKDSPGAGKGIFCLRPIKKGVCVALYSGHLVDDKGAVVISCPLTASLFTRLPSVKRPYSRGHGVYVNSVACPHILKVDGEFEFVA